jgi:hypothetical protein
MCPNTLFIGQSVLFSVNSNCLVRCRLAFHYHPKRKGIELKKFAIYFLFCSLLTITFTISAEAEIQALWEKYAAVLNQTEESQSALQYPGRIVGSWPEKPERMFFANWPFRGLTYEIFFSQKRELARMIFGLALFTKDIDSSISLEKFEKGAQGFHYSISQVVSWANTVLQGELKFNTNEEFVLLYWLMEDEAISLDSGKWAATGRIKHILGVTPGRKRSLKVNLNHERFHVIWDEDLTFREKYTQKWNMLSEIKKEEILKEFKNYDQTNINQIIEEWAVRQNESDVSW